MKEHHGHPRYRGPVIDVHVHYDADSREHARATNRTGGLATAIQLWDVTWPPPRFVAEADDWRALEPDLVRCHVPDLSNIGGPGFERQLVGDLTEAATFGAVGIKVWKNLGLKLTDAHGARVAVDDPRIDPLWATAADLGLPVLIHAGDPPEMWQPKTPDNPRAGDLLADTEWWYSAGGYPPLAQIQDELERLVAKHPHTTFVGAHFGCFLTVPELARWFEAYPNFNADTAAAVSEIGRGDVSAARDLFLAWPDRFLFGTDLARVPSFEYPDFGVEGRWDLDEYFELHWRFFETAERDLRHPIPEQVPWTVTGIDLPDDVLAKLYAGNATRLYPRLPVVAEARP